MKKTKITYALLLACTSITLPSCTDLTPIDYSEINPSNFPKTESDIQSLVLSCYYPLRGSWWDGIFSTSERGIMFLNDATTRFKKPFTTLNLATALHVFCSASPIS